MISETNQARIDLRPVASLLPHEETIQAQLEKIVAAIRRDAVQKDPLVVDRESGTVLDGMHRLAAFKKIGAEYAVCYLTDYSSKAIVLHRWIRVIEVSKRQLLPHLLENLAFDKTATFSEAFDLVDKSRNAVAIIGSKGCYIPRDKLPNLASGFDLVRKIDSAAESLGWKESFVSEDEIDIAIQDEKNLAILTPRPNKADVLEAARSGRPFPYKTTMHVIDPRPVDINFPLSELMKMTPPRPLLERILHEQEPKLLPSNSLYEGRRYKERLLLLRA